MDKQSDLVSIIVPIYNIEPYLPKCIESIINQTYQNIEIILIDDGSFDSCGKICDQFSEADDRIIVVHKKNEGLVSARKCGLDIANGKYIIHVDGDDWIDSKLVERLVEVIRADNVDFVQAGYAIEGEKNQKKIYPEHRNYELTANDKIDLLERWMHGGAIADSQMYTKIYKADVIKQAYDKVPNQYGNGEDFVAFLYLMHSVDKISVLQECFYHYRVREDSISHARKGLKLFFALDKLYEYLYQIVIELFPLFSEEKLNLWITSSINAALQYTNMQFGIYHPTYFIFHINEYEGKKIALFGAGNVGKDYYYQILSYGKASLVSWVDNNYQANNKALGIDNPKVLTNKDFDYVIIAVKNEKNAKEIFHDLVDLYSVPCEKIKWEYGEL